MKWQRKRIFDRQSALIFFEKIKNETEARVTSITQSIKTKKKP